MVSGGQGWQWTEVSRQNFLSSTRPSANISASNALLEGESESYVTCMFPFMYIEQRLTISLDNTTARICRYLLHLTNICQHIFLLQLTLCNLDLGFTFGSYYITIFLSSNDYTTSVCRPNRAILELLVLTNDVNANWPLICLKRRRQAFVHLDWINVKKVIREAIPKEKCSFF